MTSTTKPQDEAEQDLTDTLIDSFWRDYLRSGKRPASVFQLAEENGFNETDFYRTFSSLDAVESATWKRLIDNTRRALEADSDYESYPVRQKVLAFLYTFFEVALPQRSRLLAAFPRFRVGQPPTSLRKFRGAFVDWVDPVVNDAINSNEIADRKQLSERYPDLLFALLWFIVDYNLKDESDQFQDTDALIEKSVNTFFDGARNLFFDSAFDLAKFLIRNR